MALNLRPYRSTMALERKAKTVCANMQMDAASPTYASLMPKESMKTDA